MTNGRRTVLFDLDGTLINTTELILRCFHHSWSSVYGQVPEREALLKTFGIPLPEAMRLLLQSVDSRSLQPGPRSELVERLLVEYRRFNRENHDSLARPFEGIAEVMSELRRRGYSIGVVSSKTHMLGSRGLELFDLDGLVDAAVFMEDTLRHKPEPEPILTALTRLNAPPALAAYVGDSRWDIMAGRAAGVGTVAALWGPVPKSELELERPDYFAEGPWELLEIFT
jgi:pyrophosphatase PpaX